MADDDDSTIWIDVKPRVDDSAADSAVNRLKDKFSHAGDSLKDSLSGAFDSLGDHLGGVGGFGDKLHDMLADSFSGKEWDSLGQRAGTALGRGVSDALKDVTQGNFGNILGDFKSVGDVLGGALDKLSSKLDGLEKAGDSIGNVLSGNASGDDVTNILNGAKGLGINIPGPVNDISHANDIINKLNEHPGQAEDWLDDKFGFALDPLQDALTRGPQGVGEGIRNWFTGRTGPRAGSAPVDWRLENEFAQANPNAEIGDGIGNAGSMSASMTTQTMDVSAGSVLLGGNITLPGMMSGIPGGPGAPAGSRASGPGAAGSGGGIPSLPASGASGLGGAGSFSGLGFDQGGILPGGSPGHDNMIGVLPGGSMVGLEGGEGVLNPSAMQRPGITALITQLNKGFDDGTMSPAGVGGGVGGDSNNPTLSTTPTQPNTAGSAGGNTPKQQQQFGSGQGGGISGGGIIGAAEQAGVAAAGVAGFGGGAIAAQMAVQETNLAVQKASQNVAALATAPFETFGLQGGQMGAPQVNPMGGWIGKLIGGALGQMNNLPNIAGASVQPPKQPNQKDPNQPQGEGASPSGPTGAKDDPHYVKSADGTPTPPQGAMTSAMNVSPALAMSVP